MELWQREDLFNPDKVRGIYAEVADAKPDPEAVRATAAWASDKFNIEVQYRDTDRKRVLEVLGGAAIIISNHTEFTDPFVVLGAAHQEGMIPALEERVRTMCNAGAYTGRGWRAVGLSDKILDWGAMPVVTSKDYKKYKKLHGGRITQEEYRELINEASAAALEEGVELVFPEGRLNHGGKMRDFKPGVGHVGQQSAAERDTYFQPIWMEYNRGLIATSLGALTRGLIPGKEVTLMFGEAHKIDPDMSPADITLLAQDLVEELSERY